MRLWNAAKQQAEDVDDAQASTALAARLPDGSSAFLPVREHRYPLRAPDGEVGTVPGDSLLSAIRDGYQLLDAQTFDHEARKREQEGFGATLRAFGRGVASSLTLGLGVETDPQQLLSEARAAEERGDRDEANRLRDAAALHSEQSGATLAGEGVGMLAPSLIPGVGQAATGARAGRLASILGLTPAGLAARAGAAAGEAALGRFTAGAAERAAANVLAEGAASAAARPLLGIAAEEAAVLGGAAARASTAGRAIRAGVQGAVEGVPWAAAAPVPTVSEWFRSSDPELDAETVMASGLMGAALGGGVGAGFPLVGAGMRAGARMLADATPDAVNQVARGAFGSVSDGFGEAFLWAQRLATGQTPEQQAAVRVAMQKAIRDPQLVQDMLDPKRLRNEATREITQSLGRLEDGLRPLRASTSIGSPEVLQAAIDERLAPAAFDAATGIGRSVADTVDGIQSYYQREPQTARQLVPEVAGLLRGLEFFEDQTRGEAKRKLVNILAPMANGEAALAKLLSLTEEIDRTFSDILSPLEFVPGDLERMRSETALAVRHNMRRGLSVRDLRNASAPALTEQQTKMKGRLSTAWAQMTQALDGAAGAGRAVKDRYGHILALERRVPEGMNATAAYANAIDDARKVLGALVKPLARQIDRGMKGEFREGIYYRLNELYNALRSALQDQTTFGEAARLNRAVNPLFSSLLDIRDSVRKITKAGALRRDSFLHEITGDEQKLLDLMRKAGTPEGQALIRDLETTATDGARFADAIAEFKQFPAEEREAAAAAAAELAKRAANVKRLLSSPHGLWPVHSEINGIVDSLVGVTSGRAKALTAQRVSGRDAYRMLSAVRDELGDYRARLVPLIEGAERRSSLDARTIYDALTEQYQKAENALNDRRLWGDKAVALRDRLAGPSGPMAERYASAFLAPEYRIPGEVGVVRAPDPRKVSSVISRLDQADNDTAMDALESYLSDAERMASEALHLPLDAKAAKSATAVRNEAANLRSVLASKRDALRSASQYEAMVQAERMAIPLWGLAAGAGVGELLGDNPALGAGVGAFISRPATAFRARVAIERARERLTGWAAAKAASVQEGAGRAAAAIRAAAPRAVAASVRLPDDPPAARGAVLAHAAMGTEGAPLAAHAGAVATRGQQALRDAQPPDGTLSPSAWAIYADRRQAILHPSRGRASVGAMAWALPRVYPKVQQQMAWAAALRAESSRGEPDLRQATEVYLATGLPLLDHLRPDRQMRVQSLASPPSPSRASGVSPRAATRRSASLVQPTERGAEE